MTHDPELCQTITWLTLNLFSGEALPLLDLDLFTDFLLDTERLLLRSLDSWRDSCERLDLERSRDLEREEAFFSFLGEREDFDLEQSKKNIAYSLQTLKLHT